MPRFDRTGPESKGSGTGRGMGKCRLSTVNQSDDNEGKFARGYGKGRGFERNRS